MLPVDFNENDVVGPNSGFTPLLHCKRLGAELGLKHLYIKDDTVNHPTLSYKDRVVSVSITKAREFGFTTVSCAIAPATWRRRSRRTRRVRDCNATSSCPKAWRRAKSSARRSTARKVITIRGNYDDVNRLCSEIADKYGWAFVNINLRPFYTEGAKTFGFEIAEQLGWRLPDHMVLPTAGGTILPKVAKAFKELKEVGLIKGGEVKIHSAQAAGSGPVIHALHKGTDLITPVKPDTIAKSIAIGNPADGFYVLKAVRDSGGWGDVATDPEIIEGDQAARTHRRDLRRARRRHHARGRDQADQAGADQARRDGGRGITGNGYKTLEAVASSIEQPSIIDARLKDFDALFDRLHGKTRRRQRRVSGACLAYAAGITVTIQPGG